MAVISSKIPIHINKVDRDNANKKIIFDFCFNLLFSHNKEIVRHFGKFKDFNTEEIFYLVYDQRGASKLNQNSYNLSNVKIPNSVEIQKYEKNIHLKILEEINNFNDEFMFNEAKNTGDIDMIFNINNQKIPFLLHKFTLLRCSEFMRRCINFNKNNDKNNIKKRKNEGKEEIIKGKNEDKNEDKNDEIFIDFSYINISSPLTIEFFMSFLYGITTVFPLDIQLSYELYQLFDYLQIDNYNAIFDEYFRSLCLAYDFLEVVKVYGIDSPLLKK